MNKGMNLPAISKVLMEFERESDMMDMKEGMMSDTMDDVMDDMEDEEEEGDKILKQVLDEIGVDLSQKVRPVAPGVPHVFSFSLQLMDTPSGLTVSTPTVSRQAVALGETSGPSHPSSSGSGGGDTGATPDEDALQARLDALRRG